MAVTKARVDAQPDAMARRDLPKLFQHIHRTGIDRDLQLMHARQRGVVYQVSGKDDRVAVGFRIKPGRQCTFDLTQRYGVNLHALLAHQAQNMNIGAGLLRKTHYVELAQLSNLAADNLRVVDPNRAAELGGQTQQIVCVQVGIGGVKRVWHKELRCCVCVISVFLRLRHSAWGIKNIVLLPVYAKMIWLALLKEHSCPPLICVILKSSMPS